MTTASERQYRFRTGMTLSVAGAHLVLTLLGIADRLIYSVPSRYPLLIEVMSNDVWVWLHGLVGTAVFVALIAGRYQVSTIAASTGVMGAWSFLSLLWGLSTFDLPVSLVGPTMAGMIAVLSYLLTLSWARTGDTESGRE